jgi:hypothetical protein
LFVGGGGAGIAASRYVVVLVDVDDLVLGVSVRNVSVRHEALFVRTEVRDRRRFTVVAVG